MNKRTLLCGGILLTIGATISVISFSRNTTLFNSIADSQKYSITLNSSNSYSSGSSQSIRTDSLVSSVAFEYSNCTSKSGYHAHMAYGSTIKNTEQITSIQKIEASYDGALSFRYSYDGLSWTEYFNMEDQHPYSLTSNPYFFEIKSIADTDLTSLKITYSCAPNGVDISNKTSGDYEKVTAEPASWEGDYLIVYEGGTNKICFDGSSSTLDKTSNYQAVTIGSNKITSTSTVDAFAFQIRKTLTGNYPYTIKSASGYTIGTKSSRNSLASSETTNYGNAISYEDGSIKVTSENGLFLRFNSSSNQMRFRYYTSTSTSKSIQFYRKAASNAPIPKDLLGLTLNKQTAELFAGGSLTLLPKFNPTDVKDEQKGVKWISSDTSIATVDDNGKVNASASAVIGSKVTITAISVVNPELTDSCVITIKDLPASKWTILLYGCGSDLESGTSYADYLDPNDEYYEYYLDYYTNGAGACSDDISEILAVKNQPKDVNIVIQTGGATKWREKDYNLGIDASKTQRWHVQDQKLVLDQTLDKANFGLSSTLESFLTWGIETYPAQNIGVILWNHGGAMHGVCYDENYGSDSLSNSEVNQALKNTFTTLNRTEKLEFIGYDACLMAVQDVAEFNSEYFNYMIASEESESGSGWDYDNWVDNLYKGDSTEEVLAEICDTFIAENDKELGAANNDQTLSVLDLSQMEAYKKAWETMTLELSTKAAAQGKSKTKTFICKTKHYGGTDYDYFGTFDAYDFLTKLGSDSNFNPGTTYVDACKSAFNNLVIHSKAGKGAGNSNGLAFYYSNSSSYTGLKGSGKCYDANETNFSNWLQFNLTYGY